MRAMVIDGFGGPEVLNLGELPKPEPGAGQVRVQVAYAGVNPADWKTRQGKLEKYIDYKFPFVLGFDLAGTVDAVGEGVTSVAKGDKVFGTSRQGFGFDGSYAEYTIADQAMLQPVGGSLTLEEAASLPTAAVTAYGGLVDVGGLKAGQTVLINGGAGGVGSVGIQIARSIGAHIITTCSTNNADYVRLLGADVIIDYRNGNVVEDVKKAAPAGVDLVLDAVGLGTLLPHATELVRSGGTYVEIETLISAASEEEIAKGAAAGIRIVSNMIAIANLPQQLAAIAKLASDGTLKASVSKTLSLEEAAEAHRLVEDGHVRGKIVLEVAA